MWFPCGKPPALLARVSKISSGWPSIWARGLSPLTKGQADFFTLDTGVRKTGDVYGHPFPAMVADFIECIKEGRESAHNIASAVNATLACLAITKSAELDGRRIQIAMPK